MRVLLAGAACTALAGCEPSPGGMIDTRTARAGAFEVTLVLREEGTWGNPANGQHFELWCRRGASKVKVDRGYWVGGGLARAPIERVVLDSTGLLFTDLMGGAVLSFDGCADVARWNGILPVELEQVARIDGRLDEVDLLVVCPGGPELAFRKGAEDIDERGRLWVMTQDAGQSWDAEPRRSAPQMCPGQQVIVIPPVSSWRANQLGSRRQLRSSGEQLT